MSVTVSLPDSSTETPRTPALGRMEFVECLAQAMYEEFAQFITPYTEHLPWEDLRSADKTLWWDRANRVTNRTLKIAGPTKAIHCGKITPPRW